MHVHNNNNYGFTLNLDTNQPDLVNNRDSTYKINSVTGNHKQLGANQWGYGIGSDATSFNSVSNATLANVTKDSNGDCYSISDCTIKLTFGANIDPKRLPVGSYSTTLTYTATSKPAPYVPPAPDPEPYVPPKPKWTTNGCYMSRYSFGTYYGDNCSYDYFFGNDVAREIKWSGSGWAGQDEDSHCDYSDGGWILGIERVRSIGLDFSDREPVVAYVPRFAQSGQYIRFCKDATSSGCTNSEVEAAFKYGELGVWVSLTSLGCTKHVDDAILADHSYDAISAAETLAEAFGSPCPK